MFNNGFVLATPAEVIDHYYYFLTDNLDNNTICQAMLKLELITERDLVDSATMYSEYQKSSFLLDRLLLSSNIIEFCRVLQNIENKQEIGKILVNGNLRTKMLFCLYFCQIQQLNQYLQAMK